MPENRILKLLLSATSLDEATKLLDWGAEILDVKNPSEGSLGAQPPWVIGEIVTMARGRGASTSAALGDFPAKPGTAALAAYAAGSLGVDYIKVGLFGPRTRAQAAALLASVRRAAESATSGVRIIAAGYADSFQFDGLPPRELINAARDSGCDGVMLDTVQKCGCNLFTCLAESELGAFVAGARESRLSVGLAGSIGIEHLPALHRLAPDVIGVRSAICVTRNRTAAIDEAATREFVRRVASLAAAAATATSHLSPTDIVNARR